MMSNCIQGSKKSGYEGAEEPLIDVYVKKKKKKNCTASAQCKMYIIFVISVFRNIHTDIFSQHQPTQIFPQLRMH